MEIIKSRYGSDRSIERIDFKRIRVMGESIFTRTSKNESGAITMFDFEGGPAYTIGAKIMFERINYKIKKIVPFDTNHKDLIGVTLYVKSMY
jgi:hypothetical protein